MSGGSWDYFFTSLNDVADRLMNTGCAPERWALGRHMRRLSDVMKAIEWADSGDRSQEEATKAIKDFFDEQESLPAMVLADLEEEFLALGDKAVCWIKFLQEKGR